MSFGYNEKILLITMTALTLICILVSVYFVTNRILIQKIVKFQKVHVLDTTNSLQKNYALKYEKSVYNPPLDSSTTNPDQWNRIARDVSNLYNDYDKIIVVVGEDTLTYPATALSFMLESIEKPIVVTSPKYLEASLSYNTSVPEVMVFNGKQYLRANRTYSPGSDIFLSDYPALKKGNSLPKSKEPFKTYYLNPKISIAVVKVYPNMSLTYLSKLLETNVNVLILELWGSGEMTFSKAFLQIIQSLKEKGVLVCSNLAYNIKESGVVNPQLASIGVLFMNTTTEAAYSKISFIFSNVEDKKMYYELLSTNLRGEL
jgi:L-asparaginase